MAQIRVLHVLGATNLGGVESRVMELYRAMDKEQVQFDFLIHTTKEGYYSKEIRELGGNIYALPRFKVYNYLKYKKSIESFFAEHTEFAAVHGHMTSTGAIYLPIAKQVYQKNGKDLLTIAHARSAGVDQGIKGYLTRFIRRNLKKKAQFCFTCSKEAGVAVFGEDWVRQGRVWTIPNAINVSRFSFQEHVRNEVRAELELQDKFVIGHVGRLSFMKNHSYLIDIFAELCRQREDMVMVLIGSGEQEASIREKLMSLGLEDRVLLLGNKYDVERYYQAFDYFVFPSIFEGLPGSVIEAQAAGLHCLISDKITKEVCLTPLTSVRSIEENPKLWAEEILSHIEDAKKRPDVTQILCEQGFDVQKQTQQMADFYRTGINPPGHQTT